MGFIEHFEGKALMNRYSILIVSTSL